MSSSSRTDRATCCVPACNRFAHILPAVVLGSGSWTTTRKTGRPEMVSSGFPEVELVASDTNLGFGAANNLVIGRGRAPYVLVLNPDTRVTAGVLDRLYELMESEPSIGIAGCRLELEDGTFDHAARRSFPTPMGALAHFTRSRPPVERTSMASPVPRTVRRKRAGRRSERRIHAHAAAGARGSRSLRRGVLDVHGGLRSVLSVRSGRMAHVV